MHHDGEPSAMKPRVPSAGKEMKTFLYRIVS